MPEDLPPSSEAPRRALADRLNYLFAAVRPADGDREYTGREVVAAISAAGTELSASHLSELRRGIKANPTVRVLEGLAQFFQVRVAYLTGDSKVEREVESELELRRAMRDARVRDIAARAAGLDATQRSALQQLLTQLIRENGGSSQD